MAVRQVATTFGVSIAYIYKALIRRRLTGDSGPNPNRGHRPRKLSADQEVALAGHIRSRPGVTLAQAQAWLLAEHSTSLSTVAMWNAARRLGLSFKKSPARSRAGQAGRGSPRDCQDFRVWAGIMGKKESHYVATQGAGDPG